MMIFTHNDINDTETAIFLHVHGIILLKNAVNMCNNANIYIAVMASGLNNTIMPYRYTKFLISPMPGSIPVARSEKSINCRLDRNEEIFLSDFNLH